MDMCTVIGAACRFECVQGTDGGAEGNKREETYKGVSHLFSYDWYITCGYLPTTFMTQTLKHILNSVTESA